MDTQLLSILQELNPWLTGPNVPIIDMDQYNPRKNMDLLLKSEWDKLCLVLVGPRQSGKTTLGKMICQQLIVNQRFQSLLYLNCDFSEIRKELSSFLFIKKLIEEFGLKKPIVFIDEVQRLESPGLLLKTIIDAKMPVKLMASGSSQLEIKSKVQEFLTGRQLEAVILPFSYQEADAINKELLAIYGCYPDVILSAEKEIILDQLYRNYINKDIIEILKVGHPDVMQKLITLMAHMSGQLVNYNQLSIDCKVSAYIINNYIDILENTYILAKVKPFVGNKRKEITSNPKYYFIDNGFRNRALQNYSELNDRIDNGLLIEGAVYQEILKYKTQNFFSFDIYFWRTQSGAEVDFILYKNKNFFIPIEVKYRQMDVPHISRSFRSYIDAYKPKVGLYITKNILDKITVNDCTIHLIPFEDLEHIFPVIGKGLDLE